MPVTLIVGERDQTFTGIAEQMALAIGDAEVVVVPGAADAVHLESPAQTAAAIRAGRRRCPAGWRAP